MKLYTYLLLLISCFIFTLTGCRPNAAEPHTQNKPPETADTPSPEKRLDLESVLKAKSSRKLLTVSSAADAKLNPNVDIPYTEHTEKIPYICGSFIITYPIFKQADLDSAVILHIDQILMEAESIVDEICENLSDNSRKPDPGVYEIRIDPVYSDKKAVDFTAATSYNFDQTPMERSHVTFMLHPETGKDITLFDALPDQLLSDSKIPDEETVKKYLTVMSKISYEQLLQKLGEQEADQIKKGTAPDAGNFKYVTRNKSGITITFHQYQVSSESSGEHHINIPWTAF